MGTIVGLQNGYSPSSVWRKQLGTVDNHDLDIIIEPADDAAHSLCNNLKKASWNLLRPSLCIGRRETGDNEEQVTLKNLIHLVCCLLSNILALLIRCHPLA